MTSIRPVLLHFVIGSKKVVTVASCASQSVVPKFDVVAVSYGRPKQVVRGYPFE